MVAAAAVNMQLHFWYPFLRVSSLAEVTGRLDGKTPRAGTGHRLGRLTLEKLVSARRPFGIQKRGSVWSENGVCEVRRGWMRVCVCVCFFRRWRFEWKNTGWGLHIPPVTYHWINTHMTDSRPRLLTSQWNIDDIKLVEGLDRLRGLLLYKKKISQNHFEIDS